jgi:N-acyl-D-aspartate/D-glutamate deacylase
MLAPGILTSLLPEWAFEGGIEKLLERLRDEGMRREMRIRNTKAQARLALDGQWHRIFIEYCRSKPAYMGRSIKDVAEAEGKDPWDVVFDLILAEKENCYNILTTAAGYTLEDGIKVLKHPTAAPESDGMALAPYGPLGSIKMGIGSYGFIPYFFEKYVREKRLFRLEEAVRKCTSLPVQRFNLPGRGVLREEMWADIVVFDPEHIKCLATFAQPNAYPEGIKYVVVNGEVVVEGKQHTGALPGKPLRAE